MKFQAIFDSAKRPKPRGAGVNLSRLCAYFAALCAILALTLQPAIAGERASGDTNAKTAQNSAPMLLGVYDGSQDVRGWVYSEKLDGVRGIWDGRRLLSRQGLPFVPPARWVRDFPPFAIDGEIYSEKLGFEEISSITASASADYGAWRALNLHVFDAPNASGDLFARLNTLQEWLDTHPDAHIRIIVQHPLDGRDPRKIMREYAARGAEGIVLRDPAVPYRAGRQSSILKLKPAFDSECRVLRIIRHSDGQARSIECEWRGADDLGVHPGAPVRFRLSLLGVAKTQPPAIGSVVNFTYKGLTKNKKPKFASIKKKK